MAIPLLFALFQPDSRPEALGLLKACLTTQSHMDHVSVRGISESTREWDPDYLYRVSFWVRRDKDRYDRSGEVEIFKKGSAIHSRGFRVVFKNGKQIDVQWRLDGKGKTVGGFSKHPNNNYEGAVLDGYYQHGPSKRIAEVLQESNDLEVQRQESIDGCECRVVSGDTPFGRFTLWIAPAKGSLPLKWSLQAERERLIPALQGKFPKPGNPKEQVTITRIRKVLDEVKVEKIDDVFVPMSGRLTDSTFYDDGQSLTNFHSTSRTEVNLHPVFEPDAFTLDIPERTIFSDDDHPGSGIIYRSKDQKIVPVYSRFTGSAEGFWQKKTTWWGLAAGVVLLVAAYFFLRHKRAGRI
jgi:hypothetical protein